MTQDTVLVAGGSGLVGSATIAHLNDWGYTTVNADRARSYHSDRYIEADLLDPGDVYGAVATASPDAIVHFGTVSEPTNYTRSHAFRSIVESTHNLLEAARASDVGTVCIASSINVLGKSYQDAPMELQYFPIDEDHPLAPRDPYGLGKHVAEVTADGFGRLVGNPRTISSLRFPLVRGSEVLESQFAQMDRSLNSIRATWTPEDNELFAYLHVDDAASMTRRAIEADFSGHEVFWAAADDTTTSAPSNELVDALFSGIEVRSDLEGRASLIDTGKAERVLDWEPKRSWRDL